MPRQIAEILDHSPPEFTVGPRIYTHPHIHRHAAITGIVSRRASVFYRPARRLAARGARHQLINDRKLAYWPSFKLDCVINDGSPLPPAAPPGGCGGAV